MVKAATSLTVTWLYNFTETIWGAEKWCHLTEPG